MKLWFYIEKSEQKGPVQKAELIEMLKSGQLPPDTLVWTHYMQDWMRASEAEDLRKADDTAAPPPQPASTPAAQEPWQAPVQEPWQGHGSKEAAFFHISSARLVLMSIASWGLFELYWVYRNWRYLKERDGLEIRPFWRGFFSIFFIYWLINTIHDDPQANRAIKAAFPASMLATIWVSMMFVSSILGPLSYLVVPISLISFLPFLPVQNYINAVNRSITPPPPYTKWSAGQYACLAIGILIWFGWLFVLAAVLSSP